MNKVLKTNIGKCFDSLLGFSFSFKNGSDVTTPTFAFAVITGGTLRFAFSGISLTSMRLGTLLGSVSEHSTNGPSNSCKTAKRAT